MAEVKRLDHLTELAIIDSYAKAYGQLPRLVQEEPFDEVIPLIYLWKEQNEFESRREMIRAAMQETTNKEN